MSIRGWLLLVVLGIGSGLSAQPVLRIEPDFTESFLVGYLARLDSSQAIPAPVVPRLFSQFRLVDEAVVNYRTDARDHYLLFRLANSGASHRRLLLNLQQHFFENADLFLYTHVANRPDTLLGQQLSNWQLPIVQRPLPYRLHNFLIELEPGQTLTAVLHTKVDSRQQRSKALIALYDERLFLRYDANELLIQGLLYGAIGLVFCFGLAFLFVTRNEIYGFYCLYTGAQLGYILNINGIFGHLANNPGWLADPAFGSVMVLFSTACHGSFYLRFICLNEYAPSWLWHLMNGLLAVMLILTGWIGLQPDHHLPYQLATYCNYAYLILIVGCLGLGATRRRNEVLIITLALAPMALLWGYYSLTGSLLPTNRFMFVSAFYPVLVFEMITLGVGLILRFNANQRRTLLELNEVSRNSARQVIQAQEDERTKIAANLHDDLGGTLAALQGELSMQNERHNNHLQTALDLTRRASHDLRLIAHHLMPSTFTQMGLRQALQEAVDLADQQSTTRVLLISPSPERRLSPELEINTYRILRELLTNALRHAQASRIVVQLIFYPQFLYASIEDNGIGTLPPIQTDQLGSGSRTGTGMGLKNVYLRASFLRATVNSESSSTGTLIALEIPYDTFPNPYPYPVGRRPSAF